MVKALANFGCRYRYGLYQYLQLIRLKCVPLTVRVTHESLLAQLITFSLGTNSSIFLPMVSKRLHPFSYAHVSHLKWCNMSPARNLTNKLFIYYIFSGERFIIQFSILVEWLISRDKWRLSGVRTVLQQIDRTQNLLLSLSDLNCPFASNILLFHSTLLYLCAVWTAVEVKRGECRTVFVLLLSLSDSWEAF